MEGDRIAGPNVGGSSLASNALGTRSIVFFVVGAAAPLATMTGSAPLSFFLGGVGVPGTYLVAGIVLILFAIGFTAMSSHVTDAGAFYAYVRLGLGKPVGVGAAFVALYAYSFICAGFFGIFGYWMAVAVRSITGWSSPWQLWVCLGIVIIALLGHRSVEAGAVIVSALLCLEIAVLIALAITMLAHPGPDGFTLAALQPRNLFSSEASAMYVLAFGAFIGFEATAIYAEEARTPERTIPYATYLAVAFLALFYAFISWTATVGFGVEGLLDISRSSDWSLLMFLAGDRFVGGWFSNTMLVLMITSTLAALIAFHNAVARYLFSLGREGLLCGAFGRAHPRHRSPYIASATQVTLVVVVVTSFVAAGADPYLQLLLWTNGSGIVGIIFCMLLCALAVVGYFWKNRRGHSVFRVIIAPALGAAGLACALCLITRRFNVLMGTPGLDAISIVWLLPIPLLFITGVVLARRSPGSRCERREVPAKCAAAERSDSS